MPTTAHVVNIPGRLPVPVVTLVLELHFAPMCWLLVARPFLVVLVFASFVPVGRTANLRLIEEFA